MNMEQLVQQIEEIRCRMVALEQRRGESSLPQQQLGEETFEELRTALEELQVAEEELRQQNEELMIAQEAVAAERQRYQDLFEFAPDGYLVTDANATIGEVNRVAAELINVSQNFLVGKPLDLFFTEPERQDFYSEMTRRLQQVNRIQDWEVRLSPRNGAPLDAALTMVAVRDQEGKLVAVRVCVRDITDRKRAEAALRESNEHFRLLVENAKDYAIFTLNPNGYLASWNIGAESFLGYQEAEIIGQHFSGIFTPEDQERGEDQKELRTAAANGRADDNRWHVRKDGTRLWVNGTLMALRDEAGNLLGFAKIMRDMTERKRTEEALRQSEQAATAQVEELEKLNQLKDDFLSTVSHELRTPVSNMKMAIHMLKIAPSGEARERYLQLLQSECEREAELINTLLDLQQLEAASYSISLEPVSLQDWLPSTIEPFRLRTQQRQQRLSLSLPSVQLEPLLSDRAGLGRVLTELLNNACKYTSSGGEIVLMVRQDSDPLAGVEDPTAAQSLDQTLVTSFIVSNQAEIPSEELPRIFEKLYRIPKADPWKQGGTGLGLALVQKLVQQMQGTIKVESSGGWTTFTVQLPNQPKS